jgi:hypothetical protein
MDQSARYALYFTAPPSSGLDRFGSAVIGYDAHSSRPLDLLSLAGVDPAAREAFTQEPRRYGFHATLKAPFRLGTSACSEALLEDIRTFAAGQRPVKVGRLVLAEIGRFLALVPEAAPCELGLFAGEVVAAFDRFRAPMSDAERERRQAGNLSERHKVLLDRWGYPYVFDEFRFHMTLTVPLPDDIRPTWKAALARAATEFGPLAIDAIALVMQPDAKSRFRVVERIPLTGAP